MLHLFLSCSSGTLQSNERINPDNCRFGKKSGGSHMKKISLIICLLFLLGGVVYVSPGYAQDSNAPQDKFASGQRHAPPPEAYAACQNKKSGDNASFVNPRGETITGTCLMDGNQLVLRPDRGQGNQSGGRNQGPPPEAYKACEGKSAGSVSQFVNPRGETITGTCEAENGRMVLRPNSRK
jgi:hypothetical protein